MQPLEYFHLNVMGLSKLDGLYKNWQSLSVPFKTYTFSANCFGFTPFKLWSD